MSKTKAKKSNIITLEYDLHSMNKKKEYKEMRDRVKAATGLTNKEIAHIFGPAYGEFYNWLERRKTALREYENFIVKQVIDVLNNPSSPYRELREAANDVADSLSAHEELPEPDTKPVPKDKKDYKHVSNTLKKLAQYKSDHDIGNKPLAQMLGVSESTVYQWLAGIFRPGPANASKLETWLKGQGYPVKG